MALKLAVVILNWNGKSFLEQMMPAILANIPYYAELIIADNASTDGSISFLKLNFPDIKTIEFESNMGFSKGYNEALKLIEAEYYCLLNSDIEVTSAWVEPVIDILENNPDIAVVQPKLRSLHNKSFFEYAGASGGFIDKFGYPFCRGRLFEDVERDMGQYDSVIDTFWASGAALFVRSSIYHKLKGLDEDFFAHMEEIDFCWRVKTLGYRIVINPNSTVFHVGGGTLSKENAFKTYLNFRNNHFLLIKNLPQNRLIITFFIRFFLDIIAAFLFLYRGNKKDFISVFKAMGSSICGFKKMYNKRGKENKQFAYKDTINKSAVFMHYIKRKRFFNGKDFS